MVIFFIFFYHDYLCRFFRINIIKLCKPLSKLDLPTLRKGSREDRIYKIIYIIIIIYSYLKDSYLIESYIYIYIILLNMNI